MYNKRVNYIGRISQSSEHCDSQSGLSAVDHDDTNHLNDKYIVQGTLSHLVPTQPISSKLVRA